MKTRKVQITKDRGRLWLVEWVDGRVSQRAHQIDHNQAQATIEQYTSPQGATSTQTVPERQELPGGGYRWQVEF